MRAMRGMLLSAALLAGGMSAAAQSLEDLNIQIHGYVTQGFLYTTQNNIFTTTSSDGSPEWSEAVVNVTAQPAPKLRIGVQARYFLLGNFGDAITLDWAAADYKANDLFGVRFGKVKTPSGLLNEIQDIDPSYMWSLLPQGIYPITSRNTILAHYGGVVYGTLNLQKAGKLEYRGWGGEREIASGDGYWLSFNELGISVYSGISEPVSGAALHWKTPLAGLMLGASLARANSSTGPFTYTSSIPSGPEKGVTITTPGKITLGRFYQPDYFGRYEKNKVMVAAEFQHELAAVTLAPIVPTLHASTHSWYAMGSYKLTNTLSAGVYVSQRFNTRSALGPSRYAKDWALSGRYDFGQYIYAKAEEHFIDGTAAGYDSALNPGGLKPDSRLTVLKIGVNF